MKNLLKEISTIYKLPQFTDSYLIKIAQPERNLLLMQFQDVTEQPSDGNQYEFPRDEAELMTMVLQEIKDLNPGDNYESSLDGEDDGDDESKITASCYSAQSEAREKCYEIQFGSGACGAFVVISETALGEMIDFFAQLDERQAAGIEYIAEDNAVDTGFVRASFIAGMNREVLANTERKGDWRNWQPDKLLLVSELNHHLAKLIKALASEESEKISEYSADLANYASKADELYGKWEFIPLEKGIGKPKNKSKKAKNG